MEPYTQPFWEGLEDGTVLIHACNACEKRFFPPTPLCPHCHGTDVKWVETAGRGKLFSFTRTHATAAGFPDELVVGTVALTEGPKLLAPIDEPYSDLEIDAPVKVEPTEYTADYDRGWTAGYPFFAARKVDVTDA